MLYNSKQCEICGLYRCNPGCENEHRQEETEEEQNDRLLHRGRDHTQDNGNGSIRQPCGGGYRVIKKKISNS